DFPSLLTENDLLKCDISNISELNRTYQNELLQLRQLLESNSVNIENESNRSILLARVNHLIDEINQKNIEIQNSKRESLLDNIENLSKLQKRNNEVTVLREKNEISKKILHTKDEYINLLMRYINSLKDNFVVLERQYKQEVDALNQCG